jgi:hypothetical protein
MERLELSVDDLLLDLQNPRIGHAANQSEALSAIVELNPEHFRTMMRSIHDHGLDPGDAFYLVDENNDIPGYTVVDGNRRLAALKVLADPTVLQGTTLSAGTIKQLREAAKGFDPKKMVPVNCVLFDDRESANDWILRRHGRGLEGEGRIPWNPLEIQRFQNDWTVLDIVDFVSKYSTFSSTKWPHIKTAVINNSSTLRRIIDARVAREWIGIEVVERDGARVPAFKREPKFVLAVLSRIFSDIHDQNITSRTVNKASEIAAYFSSLPKDLHPNDGLSDAPILFRDASVADGVKRPRASAQLPTPGVTKKQKLTKVRPPRGTLAPSRHPFAQPETTKGQQLLREASRLRLRDMPLASAYVLRAFLEHTIDTYMTRHRIPFWENNKQLELTIRAERVLQHLQKTGTAAKDLKGVRRTLTSKSDPASIQALNDYHHNKYQVPGVDVLRDAWDSAEPLFVAVYGSP